VKNNLRSKSDNAGIGDLDIRHMGKRGKSMGFGVAAAVEV